MKIFRAVMIVLIVVGIVSVAYPTIATFVADYTSTKVVIDYEKQIQQMKEAEFKKQEKSYQTVKLDVDKIVNSIKNPVTVKKEKIKLREIKTEFKNGELLGYIEAEKIDLYLPLYEGTADSVLTKGAGHLKKSSFPGGKGTHSVITSHSGRATATLFSRIEELKIEDTFIIHFLDEVLAYKVDSIKTVEPNEADPYIKIEDNKDYVTLITCTPQTINTHRLLVRGYRIPYENKNGSDGISEQVKQHQSNIYLKISIIAGVFLIVLIIITAIFRKFAYKR